MKSFNEFLEERIASGDLWHRKSLLALHAALKINGFKIKLASELDIFMRCRPGLFYTGTNTDDGALDMNVVWTMYRAAYPGLVEQRLLEVQ